MTAYLAEDMLDLLTNYIELLRFVSNFFYCDDLKDQYRHAELALDHYLRNYYEDDLRSGILYVGTHKDTEFDFAKGFTDMMYNDIHNKK